MNIYEICVAISILLCANENKIALQFAKTIYGATCYAIPTKLCPTCNASSARCRPAISQTHSKKGIYFSNLACIGLFHLKSTPPLWKKDTGIPIPVELNVKSSQEIFVSLIQVPAEHYGRFWYQVWFQLDPVTFERKIPAEDCIELSISSWNFSLRFQFQKTPCGRF